MIDTFRAPKLAARAHREAAREARETEAAENCHFARGARSSGANLAACATPAQVAPPVATRNWAEIRAARSAPLTSETSAPRASRPKRPLDRRMQTGRWPASGEGALAIVIAISWTDGPARRSWWQASICYSCARLMFEVAGGRRGRKNE